MLKREPGREKVKRLGAYAARGDARGTGFVLIVRVICFEYLKPGGVGGRVILFSCWGVMTGVCRAGIQGARGRRQPMRAGGAQRDSGSGGD